MTVALREQLTSAELAEVFELIAATSAADGRDAISQETRIDLQRGSTTLRHVLATADGSVVGYGVLTTAAGPRNMLAEIVVAPAVRRHGHGEALLGALVEAARPESLSIWAHGADAATLSFAAALGLRPDRVLWQMRRDLTDPPHPSAPDKLHLRTFRPGIDDGAFLSANAAAFTDLPDQGGWGPQDLQDRMAQDWFDPAGFFLAVAEDGSIAGFHWTKQHRPALLGEIYVLGIVPQYRRTGLGRLLAEVGLAHLHAVGNREVLLYVDAANVAARGMYEGLGFRPHDRDTLFRS